MLKGQTFFQVAYTVACERFDGVDFEGLRTWTAGLDTQFSKRLTPSIFVNGGREIARYEAIPEVGRQFGLQAQVELKPTRRLLVEPSFSFSSLRDLEMGEAFFSGYILRTRTSFQFTRELSSRLQCSDFSGISKSTPSSRTRSIPSPSSTSDRRTIRPVDGAYGLMQTQRQLFFKFQYLLRK